MIYKITNLKDKEWQGKKFKEADLVNSNGELFKVSAWAGEFDNRSEIDAELEKNDKGYWKLKKEEKPRTSQNQAFKSQVIEKAQETKAKYIGKAQDAKELSIKVASTMNKAVELAIAEIKDIKTLNTLEQDILKWREWLWVHWDAEDKDFPPFK